MDRWHRMVAIHLTAAFMLTKAVLPYMKKKRMYVVLACINEIMDIIRILLGQGPVTHTAMSKRF